ncbi:MAG: MotA/TolQ/ExbB proton channel family protein [Chlamydiales bacterium]
MSLFAANIFLTAFSQSDFFGKVIFLGLFALSAICWIVLLNKVSVARHVKRASLAFQLAIQQNTHPLFALDPANLPKPTKAAIPHPFARIFSELKQKSIDVLNKNRFFSSQEGEKAVYLSSKDLELIESQVLTTISSQTKLLNHNLFILSTIVSLAPFLGLLGTVWGILISFGELHGGAAASSNATVLSGLSTALATTILGLVIAIPALISYNYLKNFVHNLSSDMEDFLYQLLSQVEMQYRNPKL